MYIPPAFNETDREQLFAFIERHSFGVLVSQHDGAPFATHLPFLIERNDGVHGALIGHMARANPHWTQADGQKTLAVFSGPHAYISPSWYEAPNTVPTWNYAAVHATGVFRAVHDPEAMLAIVGRTVDAYESSRPVPWRFDKDNEYYRKLIQSVVAFKIEIATLEGKFKLSQNQSTERQAKVMHALDASQDWNEKAVAELMRRRIDCANKK